MVAKPKTPEADQDTAARLVRAATEVFAEKGFDGSTVKEIADRAGVNISLISYHFNGKEGIFRACLEEFGRDRLRDAEKILTSPESAEDLRAKLRLWMQQFLQCHVEQPSVCVILHRENLLDREFIMDIFKNTFLKAFEANAKFFEAAKKKGIIRKEVDPTIVASVIFGTLIHLGRNQELQQAIMGTSIQDDKYRRHVKDQLINILLNGIIGA